MDLQVQIWMSTDPLRVCACVAGTEVQHILCLVICNRSATVKCFLSQQTFKETNSII